MKIKCIITEQEGIDDASMSSSLVCIIYVSLSVAYNIRGASGVMVKPTMQRVSGSIHGRGGDFF